jgi:hypothetical protein
MNALSLRDSDGMPQFAQGLGFDLADAFTAT